MGNMKNLTNKLTNRLSGFLRASDELIEALKEAGEGPEAEALAQLMEDLRNDWRIARCEDCGALYQIHPLAQEYDLTLCYDCTVAALRESAKTSEWIKSVVEDVDFNE